MRCTMLLGLEVLLVLGTDFAAAADPVPLPALRVELMRPGSQRPAARARLQAPAVPAAASSGPNFTFFDMPSSTDTEAGALNLGVGGAAMRVVGCYVPNVGAAASYDGFEYALSTGRKKSTATYETIGPTKVDLCAYDVNDSGVVVGTYTPTGLPAGETEGFVLQGTTLKTIVAPYANTCQTLAAGVSDGGTVVGEYETNVDCTSDHGWAEGGFTWSNGTFTLEPGPAGSIDSIPSGINSAGDIVGGALNSTQTAGIGWLLHGGVYTALAYPGASITFPLAINDSGEVVGYYCADTFANCNAGSTVNHGFLYSGGTYSTIDVPGVPFTAPYGIDNEGVISGEYVDTNGYVHSFLINP